MQCVLELRQAREGRVAAERDGMATRVGAEETFGALLRRFRLAVAVSQQELAQRAGLSVDAVSTLERGRRSLPRPDTIALLAHALGLSAKERAAFVAAARPRTASAHTRGTFRDVGSAQLSRFMLRAPQDRNRARQPVRHQTAPPHAA
jgi:transcriptional regulator with XRE-family HTH domain